MADVTPASPNVKDEILSVKFLYESPADGLTALAGGGQNGATQLTTELSRVTTVATAGDSVQLPPSVPGLTIIVTNHGGAAMQVYGNGTDTINDNPSNVGVSQMAGSEVLYVCYGLGKWYANGLGTGYAGSLETLSTANGLTASATQTQAAGTIINTMFAVFTTVGVAGNAATLLSPTTPSSVQGMSITVANNGANSMNVFPDSGSKINALSVNAAFAVAASTITIFYCSTPGQWLTK
jgi:hypothetical protein